MMGLISVLLWIGIPIIAAIIVRILLQRWKKDLDFEMPVNARGLLLRRLVLPEDRKKGIKSEY